MARKRSELIVKYGSDDVFKHYVKESGNPYGLSCTKYNSIVGEFNTAVLDLIVLEHYEFKMPRRLGYLRIRKSKPPLKILPDGKLDTKRLVVDWASTKKMWKDDPLTHGKVVYHMNTHTDGYVFKWHWDKITSNAYNIKAYSFRVVRTAKRKLAKVAKDPMLKIDFFE